MEKPFKTIHKLSCFVEHPVSILLNIHGFTSSLKINFEFKWYVHTAHCTLHTAHCTLYTVHCTLHTAQFLCLMYIGLFKVIT